MSARSDGVRAEIEQWFFGEYVPTAIALLNGDDPAGATGFLQYWERPLLLTREQPEFAGWLTTDDQVLAVVKMMNDNLIASGYRDTPIPDRRVHVYNNNGGAVEAIWSRQDSAGREVERLATHFEVAKINSRWRFVAIQSRVTDRATDRDTLDGAWAF